jgi:hypothetical protein
MPLYTCERCLAVETARMAANSVATMAGAGIAEWMVAACPHQRTSAIAVAAIDGQRRCAHPLVCPPCTRPPSRPTLLLVRHHD